MSSFCWGFCGGHGVEWDAWDDGRDISFTPILGQVLIEAMAPIHVRCLFPGIKVYLRAKGLWDECQEPRDRTWEVLCLSGANYLSSLVYCPQGFVSSASNPYPLDGRSWV